MPEIMDANLVARRRHEERARQREERRKNLAPLDIERTQVDDMDRGVYDIKNTFEYTYMTDKGLTEKVIHEIHDNKEDEPEWMLQKRLAALEIFNKSPNPPWGPDLTPVDMEQISMYIRPKAQMESDWTNVPDEIRDTFDKLGIPEAELEQLAGVGAQYDSEVVYHNMKDYLLEQGVIYTDFESAVRDYPEMIQEHFGTVINPNLHRYAALHYAVWSGGSFVYVPEGVEVDIPLQS